MRFFFFFQPSLMCLLRNRFCHRLLINSTKKLKTKRPKYLKLDGIKGIGRLVLALCDTLHYISCQKLFISVKMNLTKNVSSHILIKHTKEYY